MAIFWGKFWKNEKKWSKNGKKWSKNGQKMAKNDNFGRFEKPQKCIYSRVFCPRPYSDSRTFLKMPFLSCFARGEKSRRPSDEANLGGVPPLFVEYSRIPQSSKIRKNHLKKWRKSVKKWPKSVKKKVVFLNKICKNLVILLPKS